RAPVRHALPAADLGVPGLLVSVRGRHEEPDRLPDVAELRAPLLLGSVRKSAVEGEDERGAPRRIVGARDEEPEAPRPPTGGDVDDGLAGTACLADAGRAAEVEGM